MKNLILIFSTLTILLSCGNDNEQDKSIITENATVYYDPSGIDNCVYIFKIDNGNYYTVEDLNKKFRENDLRVKISYSKTERRLNCGFAGSLIIIKIESIQACN